MKVNCYLPYDTISNGHTHTHTEKYFQLECNLFERQKQNLPHAYHHYAWVDVKDIPKELYEFLKSIYTAMHRNRDGIEYIRCWIRRDSLIKFNPKDISYDTESNFGTAK